MPEPLSEKIGLGMKVTVLPACAAVFLMMYLYFIMLSAEFRRVLNRKSISAWPAVATSWCWHSTSMPQASIVSTISDRRFW